MIAGSHLELRCTLIVGELFDLSNHYMKPFQDPRSNCRLCMNANLDYPPKKYLAEQALPAEGTPC